MRYMDHPNGDMDKRQWYYECGLNGHNARMLENNYERRFVSEATAKDLVKEASEKFDEARFTQRCQVIYPIITLVGYFDGIIASGEIKNLSESHMRYLSAEMRDRLNEDRMKFRIYHGQSTTVQIEQIRIFTQTDYEYIEKLRKVYNDMYLMVRQGLRYDQIRRVEDMPIMEVAHA